MKKEQTEVKKKKMTPKERRANNEYRIEGDKW